MKTEEVNCDCCGNKIGFHNNNQWKFSFKIRRFYFYGFKKEDRGELDICESCKSEIFEEVKSRINKTINH